MSLADPKASPIAPKPFLIPLPAAFTPLAIPLPADLKPFFIDFPASLIAPLTLPVTEYFLLRYSSLLRVEPFSSLYAWNSSSACFCLSSKFLSKSPITFWARTFTPGNILGIMKKLHKELSKPATNSSTTLVSVTPSIDSAWSAPATKSVTKNTIVSTLDNTFLQVSAPTFLIPFSIASSKIPCILSLMPLNHLAEAVCPKDSATDVNLLLTVELSNNPDIASFNLVRIFFKNPPVLDDDLAAFFPAVSIADLVAFSPVSLAAVFIVDLVTALVVSLAAVFIVDLVAASVVSLAAVSAVDLAAADTAFFVASSPVSLATFFIVSSVACFPVSLATFFIVFSVACSPVSLATFFIVSSVAFSELFFTAFLTLLNPFLTVFFTLSLALVLALLI